MNRSKYVKILFCVCLLTVGLLEDRAPSQPPQSDSVQSTAQDIGRENPFAAIPRNLKPIPRKLVQTSQLVEESPELFLETITLRFLNAENLENVVKNMSSAYGSITSDKNTNSLIVCDAKEVLARIIAEVKKIDKRPQQIMVEVVILDVQLKDDTEIGINWDLLSDKRYGIGYRQNFTTSRLKTTPESSTTKTDATAFNTIGFGGDLSVISSTIRNVIHLIQEKRDAEIIASPRAMMVSGQSATIQAVEEIPYQEQSETSGGGSMTSTEFKNVGVSLLVTATITDGNDIFLKVDTEQNVKTGESISGVPVVDTRKANTSLLLRDGQIVVLGGLRRQEKIKEVDQIPILGDLPIIGELFKNTQTVINNSELIVLLSPHIYKGEPVPDGVMAKYNEIKDRPVLSIPDEREKEDQLKRVDDEAQGSETTAIPVNNVSRSLDLEAIGDKSVDENSNLSFSVSATDPDGDTITYSVDGLPSGATFTNQTFSWTPGYEQAGTYQATFIANDSQVENSETITITVKNVNRVPALSAIGNRSIYVNDSLSFAVSATDPDGDTITYSVDGLPIGATFTNQTFSWTPSQSQVGSYKITFSTSDSQLQDSETITMTVHSAE